MNPPVGITILVLLGVGLGLSVWNAAVCLYFRQKEAHLNRLHRRFLTNTPEEDT